MIEKPNTPQKLANKRKIVKITGSKFKGKKSCGCKCKTRAIIHPTAVATTIIIDANAILSKPERISTLEISNPEVMKGKPGITNNIAPI